MARFHVIGIVMYGMLLAVNMWFALHGYMHNVVGVALAGIGIGMHLGWLLDEKWMKRSVKTGDQ